MWQNDAQRGAVGIEGGVKLTRRFRLFSKFSRALVHNLNARRVIQGKARSLEGKIICLSSVFGDRGVLVRGYSTKTLLNLSEMLCCPRGLTYTQLLWLHRAQVSAGYAVLSFYLFFFP